METRKFTRVAELLPGPVFCQIIPVDVVVIVNAQVSHPENRISLFSVGKLFHCPLIIIFRYKSFSKSIIRFRMQIKALNTEKLSCGILTLVNFVTQPKLKLKTPTNLLFFTIICHILMNT